MAVVRIGVSVARSNTFAARLAIKNSRLAYKVELGLLEAGGYLHKRSQQLVPLDTTTLFEDGHLRQEGSGLGTVVVVGYGTYGVTEKGVYSPNEGKVVDRTPSEYAVIVHEDASKVHPHGQYEYLAMPLRTEREEIRLTFEAAVRS